MFDVAVKLREVEEKTSLTIATLDEAVRVLKKVYGFVRFYLGIMFYQVLIALSI